MKKSILLSLLASLMLILSCNSGEYLIAPERENWTFEIAFCGKTMSLYGNVESITITRDGYPLQAYTFNVLGDVIQKTEYECDGDTPDIYTYLYDTDGYTSEVKVTRGKKTRSIAKYRYDNNGNLIERHTNDGVHEKDIYEYDENCRKVAEKHYISRRQINKTAYKYDELGNVIEEKTTNPNGREVWSLTSYEYDSKGRISKKTYSDCSYKYEYDDHGNPIEIGLYMLDGTPCGKEKFKYDSKGNMIQKCDYKQDGTITYKYDYNLIYDSQNNVTKAEVEVYIDGSDYENIQKYELNIQYRQ